MENLYMVGYSEGSYEDYRTRQVFVTPNKKVANKWKAKADSLVKKWRIYYNSPEGKELSSWSDFRYALQEFNEVYIEEIEIRTK